LTPPRAAAQWSVFFFFRAEDGIRDFHVTGVQTCALPICQQLFMTAYGVGSQMFGMLPFSRKHETEADEIGLLLMALAGYNPDHAVTFWQRMAANSGGAEPPQWLSTHPSNTTRINNIQKLIPSVKQQAAKFGVTFQ